MYFVVAIPCFMVIKDYQTVPFVKSGGDREIDEAGEANETGINQHSTQSRSSVSQCAAASLICGR